MYAANPSLALGADVPTAHGTFTATTSPPYCGSPFALQQMLADLGFYSGPINGQVDEATLSAAANFGRSRGISNLSYVTTEYCRLLTSEWQKLQAGAMIAVPASTAVPLRTAGSAVEPAITEPPPGMPPPVQSGWAALDDTTKYAIAGAAALGLVGVVAIVMVGKKRKKR